MATIWMGSKKRANLMADTPGGQASLPPWGGDKPTLLPQMNEILDKIIANLSQFRHIFGIGGSRL
jgi:hypothetical protein